MSISKTVRSYLHEHHIPFDLLTHDCSSSSLETARRAHVDEDHIAKAVVYVYSRSGATWSQHAYVKASNSAAGDQFGQSVSLNVDGTALAVGALYEDSSADGIDGDQADNAANGSGAVYLY